MRFSVRRRRRFAVVSNSVADGAGGGTQPEGRPATRPENDLGEPLQKADVRVQRSSMIDTLLGRTQELCLLAHAAWVSRARHVCRTLLHSVSVPAIAVWALVWRGFHIADSFSQPSCVRPGRRAWQASSHSGVREYRHLGNASGRLGCFAPHGDGPVRRLAALNRHAGICFEHAMQVGLEFLRGAAGPCTGQFA